MWRCFVLLVTVGLALVAAPGRAASSCPPPLPAVPPSTASATNTAAKDHGLLWRVSRDGRTSYLFGTLHVGKPAWSRLGPQLTAAMAQSDALALEVDPSDPGLADALAAALPLAAASASNTAELTPALQARLTKAYQRACVEPQGLVRLHPVLQVTTLAVLQARWLGADSAFASEQLLAALARSRGLAVVSLETPALQVQALVPGDAVEAEKVLTQGLTQLEQSGGRRVLARLLSSWESGDLVSLENFAAWCECVSSAEERAFYRRLNDDRNPALADGIEAQHQQGQRVLAAVGALHMTGPQSLPRLLAQRGFTVERVAFAGTSKPAKPRTPKP
jgi:uncharacterized protein